MRRRYRKAERHLLAGTFDMLIVRTLQAGAAQGLQIAQDIERRSDSVLLVEQRFLYPGLHRLEERGWTASSWGESDTNRGAKFYELTITGKKQLRIGSSRWPLLTRAVASPMKASEAKS